ncbi:MAG TPA: HAD-IA family hydrolase [Gaiellaceae bacterium]|nr:HAD-IA family hydrolase [Gaiellaceae bacterium]
MIFDLWDTLIRWDQAVGDEFFADVAELLGSTPEETLSAWDEGRSARSSGPMLDYLRTLGLEDGVAAAIVERRRELARRAIVPVDGAVETIRELRDGGLKVGLLSVCSDEVPAVWAETAFAGLFDAEVFSCDVGLLKPDPRIYALTCERLRVQPHEALFVGDGANDELAGAERAGLRAVQILLYGEPRWPESRDWQGPRVSSPSQVLELV